MPISLIGGVNDRDQVAQQSSCGIDLVGRTSLLTSLMIVVNALAVIGAESWAASAAGAFGVPTILVACTDSVWENRDYYRSVWGISNMLPPSSLDDPDCIFDELRRTGFLERDRE